MGFGIIMRLYICCFVGGEGPKMLNLRTREAVNPPIVTVPNKYARMKDYNKNIGK